MSEKYMVKFIINTKKCMVALSMVLAACAVGPDYEAKKWEVSDKYSAEESRVSAR